MVDPFLDYLERRPVKQRIFQVLTEHPYGVTTGELAWHVWRGCHEPMNAGTTLNVHLTFLRKAMRGFTPWLTIACRKQHSGRRHMLVLRRPPCRSRARTRQS